MLAYHNALCDYKTDGHKADQVTSYSLGNVSRHIVGSLSHIRNQHCLHFWLWYISKHFYILNQATADSHLCSRCEKQRILPLRHCENVACHLDSYLHLQPNVLEEEGPQTDLV